MRPGMSGRVGFALLTAAVLPAIAAPVSAQPCRDAGLAFVDVAVVRPESGRTALHQTVVVHCGRISAVGPTSRVRPPRGARRIAASGKFLSPGLVDGHGHGTEQGWARKLYLAFGITSVRELNGSPEALAAQSAIRAGMADGPTLYLSTPPLRGDEPDWQGKDPLVAARLIVSKARAAGYEYIKTYYQLSPAQFDALATASAEAKMALVGHVPRSITLAHALPMSWSIEHLTGFDDALEDPARHVTGPGSAMLSLRRFAVADESRIPTVARQVAASASWQVPTLLTYDIWARPNDMAHMVKGEIAGLVGQAEIDRWTAPNPWYVTPPGKQTDADRQAIVRAASIRKQMVKALFDAGAKLAVGTDAGEVYVVPGLSMHDEMELYEEAGISRPEILKMATVNGAKLVRHEGDFGTIEAGKRADLLLLDANPFRGLRTLRQPAAVVAAGRYYSRHDVARLLQEVRAEQGKPNPG